MERHPMGDFEYILKCNLKTYILILFHIFKGKVWGRDGCVYGKPPCNENAFSNVT